MKSTTHHQEPEMPTTKMTAEDEKFFRDEAAEAYLLAPWYEQDRMNREDRMKDRIKDAEFNLRRAARSGYGITAARRELAAARSAR
jgi:hypothetical protein